MWSIPDQMLDMKYHYRKELESLTGWSVTLAQKADHGLPLLEELLGCIHCDGGGC